MGLGPEAVLHQLPVEFVGSFPDPRHRLVPSQPEIAFVGRSNVGKSSLVNAVVGRKIAKTSGTPGKTQHLVAFRLPTFYLLDLPGYGWARRSLTARRELARLIEGALTQRDRLAAVVWLLDVRHPPSREDREIEGLLGAAKRETIVALTKVDKLPRGQLRTAVVARARELDLDPADLVPTSTKTGTGIVELGEMILEAAGGR